MENAETTRDQPDGGSMQDILSLQHSTDTYSLTLPAQGEISAIAQRGYEGYWLWNHLMRPSWLWDHLMRPSWLWDHLMRPSWLWDHLMRPFWLWDHLMGPSWLWDHLIGPSWLWDHLMRPSFLSLSVTLWALQKKLCKLAMGCRRLRLSSQSESLVHPICIVLPVQGPKRHGKAKWRG